MSNGSLNTEFNAISDKEMLNGLDAYDCLFNGLKLTHTNRKNIRRINSFFPPGIMRKLYVWARKYYNNANANVQLKGIKSSDMIVRSVFLDDGLYYADYVSRIRQLFQMEHKSLGSSYSPVSQSIDNIKLTKPVSKEL